LKHKIVDSRDVLFDECVIEQRNFDDQAMRWDEPDLVVGKFPEDVSVAEGGEEVVISLTHRPSWTETPTPEKEEVPLVDKPVESAKATPTPISEGELPSEVEQPTSEVQRSNFIDLDDVSTIAEDEQVETNLRRSTRERRRPERLVYDYLGIPEVQREEDVGRSHLAMAFDPDGDLEATAHLFSACGDPESYKEIQTDVDKEEWLKALKDEEQSLLKNETFEVVPIPRRKKLIRSKWVLRRKYNADGSVRFKARLVAKGFTQTEGVDYGETYAPVVKYKSLRMLLALATQRRMLIHQMDVTNAFLYGDIDAEIYVVPPEGVSDDLAVPGTCWKLKRSLYGLKQSPRCWNKRLHDFLMSIGFHRAISDYATYTRGSGHNQTIIAIYVDDMLIMSENQSEINKTKSALSKEFEMKDLGEVSTVLGMRIRRNIQDGWLFIDQEAYIKKILKEYNMEECRPACSTLTVDTKFSLNDVPKTKAEIERMSKVPYREAIGTLMYLMVSTRPDIATAIGILSRYLKNPGPRHWEGVKRVFRYLKGTVDHGIRYNIAKSKQPIAFCDADWAGCLDTRRSTSGYVLLLSGGAVAWSSRRQKVVAGSSTEAEYVSMYHAISEVVWEKAFLQELGVIIDEPLIIGSDSDSALKLANNPVHHEKSKHIDIKMHFLRDYVENRTVDIIHVPDEYQVADSLTKAVTQAKLTFCREQMGVVPYNSN